VDATNPELFSAGSHPAGSVLRHYLAGALVGNDRLRLVEHLRDCEDCRTALEILRTQPPTQTVPPAIVPVEPASPPQTLAQSSADLASADLAPDGLRLPAWLVAAGLLLIVVESAGLLRGAWMRTATRDATTTRSAAATMTAPRIKVLFVGSASDQAIRALLRTVHGRIVDGPSPEGSYVVEIRPDSMPGGENALQILRNRIDLVKQVGAGPSVEGR
jgi:hypothetical protein